MLFYHALGTDFPMNSRVLQGRSEIEHQPVHGDIFELKQHFRRRHLRYQTAQTRHYLPGDTRQVLRMFDVHRETRHSRLRRGPREIPQAHLEHVIGHAFTIERQ